MLAFLLYFSSFFFFFLMIRRSPRFTLFPYTTLFRSILTGEDARLAVEHGAAGVWVSGHGDRKSTRLNSSSGYIPYAVFCLKKKKPLDQCMTRAPGTSTLDNYRRHHNHT